MRSTMAMGGVIAVFTTLLIAKSAAAQGWVHLPGGRVGYITDYTTTGFFTCGAPKFYPGGVCSTRNNGRVMTIGHGGNLITLMFEGFSQTVTAGKPQLVPIGTITKKYNGTGPFTFPAGRSKNAAMFNFTLRFNTTFPLPGSKIWRHGYTSTSPAVALHPTNFGGFNNHIWFPVTPPPPPFRLGALQYYNLTGTTMTAGPAPINMFATVATTPEPATLWLTGSGLVGLFAAARRRHRSRRT